LRICSKNNIHSTELPVSRRYIAPKQRTYLNSSCFINSMTISFSGWICSILQRRQRNGVGLTWAAVVPPIYWIIVKYVLIKRLLLIAELCRQEARQLGQSIPLSNIEIHKSWIWWFFRSGTEGSFLLLYLPPLLFYSPFSVNFYEEVNLDK